MHEMPTPTTRFHPDYVRDPGLRHEREGDVLVVRAAGNMRVLNNGSLVREVDELLAAQDAASLRAVVACFDEAEGFGSMMLEALLLIWRRIQPHQGRLLLCGLNDFTREVIETAHYHLIWPIYPDRRQAVAAAQN
jgi:hypothetical protein